MSGSDRPTVTVAVAFHSGYGHTAVLAEAVARGAAEAGAEVVSVAVDAITEEQWAQLDAADAIVFGAPTYMGTASAAFHAFAEASSKRWYAQTWADKIAAGFTNSGAKNGDKSFTLGYFFTMAARHIIVWTALPDSPSHDGLRLLASWAADQNLTASGSTITPVGRSVRGPPCGVQHPTGSAGGRRRPRRNLRLDRAAAHARRGAIGVRRGGWAGQPLKTSSARSRSVVCRSQ
ncbi:flavodoxin domain-containing protein [Streptomyces sp. NPDC047061]|uniref:flavodoxin family protein n=1 Tax=Streptomyces sp. NPDC047061 TaxID=3154605 RepID=UPI0033F98F85